MGYYDDSGFPKKPEKDYEISGYTSHDKDPGDRNRKIFVLIIISIFVIFILSMYVIEETKEQEVDNIKGSISNLVAYWSFDEGTGSKTYDLIGNNNGTIYGAAWNTGISGKALEFDGIDDYVSIPDNDSLRPNDVTLLLWLYPTENNPDSRWFVGKGCRDRWYNQDACSYGIDCDDIGDDGTVEIHTVLETDNNYQTMVNYTIPSLNRWYHVAMTFDNSSQEVKLYVNGILRGSADHGQGLRYNSPWDFIIGGSHTGTGNGVNKWERCAVDEIQIYNRALNDSEIQYLYKKDN